MAKPRTQYECTSCGAVFPKWLGRCSSCGAWDSVVEITVIPAQAGVRGGARAGGSGTNTNQRPVLLKEAMLGGEPLERLSTGSHEIDNILGGGGVVPGSLVLIGGDPGIGKSTLMLQVAANMAARGAPVIYLSGEESTAQIGMRARRLEIDCDNTNLVLLTETCFEAIEEVVAAQSPRVLIVDSIQTVYTSGLGGIPGSVGQVRESSAGFMRLAKNSGLCVFLVGHVTKDGSIAGPRVLEHMVDTVLYFEGESSLDYRILRVVKNRFGSTNEIGLFEMRAEGLAEVREISAFFLEGRAEGSPGSAVVCTLEGNRPLLAEAQALVAPTGYGTAQRVSTGYDNRRLAIMLAILEKRMNLPFSSQDVFVNFAGGLKVYEPAADLGVCVGLCSSLRDKALGNGTVLLGEVGLGGELRAVSRMEHRLAECA
ncbi:MAG: DNA repair protein RadA, partial [Gemmatimonadota bacterium]|nr:DNA repair protein RadA [Gemmatimonadota bacterium]